MALRNSPESRPSSTTGRGTAKLTQFAAVLAMAMSSTAAQTAEAAELDCPKGSAAKTVAMDNGGTKTVCIDDEGNEVKPVRKVTPKPVAKCENIGAEGMIEVRPQPMAPINTLSKVSVNQEGKFEIMEGQMVQIRVNCVDVSRGGKVEKPIRDTARQEAVVRSQVKVFVNGNIVDAKVRTLDNLDALVEVGLPGPVTTDVAVTPNPVAHHVVVEVNGVQRVYDFLVKYNPEKAAQNKAIADLRKAEEARKAQEVKEEEARKAKEAKKKQGTTQAPAPAPTPAPQPRNAPHGHNHGSEEGADEYTSYWTGEAGYSQVLGRPSDMWSVGASYMDQRAKNTAIGGGVEVGFEGDREAIVQGREVQGASSVHIFPGLKVVQGDQHQGLAARAQIGPDIEIGNKVVLPGGVTHSGDVAAAFRAELGVGGTLALVRDQLSIRVFAIGGVMAGGMDKLGSDDSATRWNAGINVELVGHTEK